MTPVSEVLQLSVNTEIMQFRVINSNGHPVLYTINSDSLHGQFSIHIVCLIISTLL